MNPSAVLLALAVFTAAPLSDDAALAPVVYGRAGSLAGAGDRMGVYALKTLSCGAQSSDRDDDVIFESVP